MQQRPAWLLLTFGAAATDVDVSAAGIATAEIDEPNGGWLAPPTDEHATDRHQAACAFEELHELPSPAELHERHVLRNAPVMLRGVALHWSFRRRLRRRSLLETLGDETFEADSMRGSRPVNPNVRQEPRLHAFIAQMQRRKNRCVARVRKPALSLASTARCAHRSKPAHTGGGRLLPWLL